MFWRLSRKQWEENKGEGNRRALQKLVKRDIAPGVLMYVDGEPAGWCAIAPRHEYVLLANSRVLAPVDDKAVWSVSCFFVARPYRRRGLALPLLKAAAEYAHSKGATIVEGYPNELSKTEPDAFIWRGVASTFRKAGFKEAAKRSPKRPVMRRVFRRQAENKRA
jgi:GNAT superfamily N-acetyltransferase